MKNVYITKNIIGNESFSELDFVLQDEFEFNYEKQKDFIVIEKGIGNVDGYPIKINTLIESLQDLKSKGTTHVELDYHCDHIGYDISGFNIIKSTKEEIDEYEIEISKNNDKNKKLSKLYNEINRIEKE